MKLYEVAAAVMFLAWATAILIGGISHSVDEGRISLENKPSIVGKAVTDMAEPV